MNTAANYLTTLATQVPDVNPEMPPGMGGFLTVVNWFAWGAVILCMLGLIAGIGTIVWSAFKGRPVESFQTVGLGLLALALLGAVGSIVGVLV